MASTFVTPSKQNQENEPSTRFAFLGPSLNSNKLNFQDEYNETNISICQLVTIYVAVIFGFLFILTINLGHSYYTSNSNLFALSVIVNISTIFVYVFFTSRLIMFLHNSKLRSYNFPNDKSYIALKEIP